MKESEVHAVSDERAGAAGIVAVVVLYKMAIDASPTLRTLRSALAQAPSQLRVKTLVYDNSPEMQTSSSLPQDVRYIADPANSGLAKAYNLAAAIAERERYGWVLTLDQDTELPPGFLQRLTAIVESVQENTQVAAVLPRVMQGDRLLSPNWFAFDFFMRSFPSDLSGVPAQSGYGINSAATVRVSALKAIGGYSLRFPLDYSDAYLHRRLHLEGFKTYVAGDLVVQHHLSILNTQEMSDDRYRHIMWTGSAFCDLMRGRLVGAQFTYRLFRSYVGLLLRRNRSEKARMLAHLLRKRLLCRRSNRVKDWQASDLTHGLTFRD